MDEQVRNDEFRKSEGVQFPLVSDPDKQLSEALGILVDLGEWGLGMRTQRITYLLDDEGTILRRWEVGQGEAIDTHPDEVLAEVRALRLAG